jgi:hypothetical protein
MTTTEYNYTVTLFPWTNSNAVVEIDPAAQYGYFEHKDGSEGGGLWFDGMELTDFDGTYELPKAVAAALRGAGYILDSSFD